MQRIVKELHLHAYHITIQQELTDDHKKRRVTFAYWARRTLRKNDIKRILFSDEKYFTIDGIFNRQNDRIHAPSREMANENGGVHLKSKYPDQLMVWLGACGQGLQNQSFSNRRKH